MMSLIRTLTKTHNPRNVLSLGLFFFLLFIPIFVVIGDLQVSCIAKKSSDCEQLQIMQWFISTLLLFGMIIAVRGALNLTKPPKKGNIDWIDKLDLAEADYTAFLEKMDDDLTVARSTMESHKQGLSTQSSPEYEKRLKELEQKVKKLESNKKELEIKKQLIINDSVIQIDGRDISVKEPNLETVYDILTGA